MYTCMSGVMYENIYSVFSLQALMNELISVRELVQVMIGDTLFDKIIKVHVHTTREREGEGKGYMYLYIMEKHEVVKQEREREEVIKDTLYM